MPARHISFSLSSRFKTLIDKVRTLHLPASTPSDSSNFQPSASDSTGPPFLDANNAFRHLSPDDDPDNECVTDAVIVDSLLVPAAVTVSSSRRPSNAENQDANGNEGGKNVVITGAERVGNPLDFVTDNPASHTSGTEKGGKGLKKMRKLGGGGGRSWRNANVSWKARFMHSMRFGPLRKVQYYFNLRFDDSELERQYNKE
ncbi:hypothetical protein HK097_005666, partial [Rhizophlyctis rosea]